MILLIDNYDSFVFNLYQALAALGAEVSVVRNDVLSVDDVLERRPSAIVLSPGPGRPEQAGICMELLARLDVTMPLLGVCLGHQALVTACGGELELDPVPVHGKASPVHHGGRGLFRGLPDPLTCGRYHSLRAVRATLPDSLDLAGWTEDGLVMAVRHVERPWWGVQFHPESILTPQGDVILAHFLSEAGVPVDTTLPLAVRP